MFEAAEVGRKLSKGDYKAQVPPLRSELLAVQEELRLAASFRFFQNSSRINHKKYYQCTGRQKRQLKTDITKHTADCWRLGSQ